MDTTSVMAAALLFVLVLGVLAIALGVDARVLLGWMSGAGRRQR
jgi:hypothetical protein